MCTHYDIINYRVKQTKQIKEEIKRRIKMTKNKQIHFRCTEEFQSDLLQVAKHNGLDISSFLMMIAQQKINEYKKENKLNLKEMLSMRNLLNAIVEAVNTRGNLFVTDKNELIVNTANREVIESSGHNIVYDIDLTETLDRYEEGFDEDDAEWILDNSSWKSKLEELWVI